MNTVRTVEYILQDNHILDTDWGRHLIKMAKRNNSRGISDDFLGKAPIHLYHAACKRAGKQQALTCDPTLDKLHSSFKRAVRDRDWVEAANYLAAMYRLIWTDTGFTTPHERLHKETT